MSSGSVSLWGKKLYVKILLYRTQALTFIFASILTGSLLHRIGRPRGMIFGVLLIVTSLILTDMVDRLDFGSGIPKVRA